MKMTKAIITCKSGRKYVAEQFKSFNRNINDELIEVRVFPYFGAVEFENKMWIARNSVESIVLEKDGDEHE